VASALSNDAESAQKRVPAQVRRRGRSSLFNWQRGHGPRLGRVASLSLGEYKRVSATALAGATSLGRHALLRRLTQALPNHSLQRTRFAPQLRGARVPERAGLE